MRKFNRKKGQRKIFMRSLADNLISRGTMTTTVARAKETRPMVERLLSIAKKQDLASLRKLYSALPKASAEKLYYDIAPQYTKRKGGYLRIVRLPLTRKRDGAETARIEFVK